MKEKDASKPRSLAGRKAKVLIVEDHALVRQGLRRLIEVEGHFTVSGEAEDGPQALEMISRSEPDIAVVDIGLPGMNGIELIKNIKARAPRMPVLVISMYDESIYAERALRAGARGYIMKKESAEKVVEGLRQVLSGKLFISPAVSERMLSQIAESPKNRTGGLPVDLLSDRELEVFELIGHGYKSAQIAQELNIGVKTVESYREQIKVKLNFEHSSELARFAIEWVHSEGSPP